MAHLDGHAAGASPTGTGGTAAPPPPLGQRLYDNVFLLLAVGILIMVAVYTGWGIWEVVTMPAGALP